MKYDVPALTHRGKTTTVMVDGHVEWVPWQEVNVGGNDYFLLPE
jgi:prepilin-type processing-associated H-X9-DG protein